LAVRRSELRGRNFLNLLGFLVRTVGIGWRQIKAKHIMSKNIRSKSVTAAGLLAVCLLAAACNTVAGAGKDTSAAGHAVTNTAEQAKP
jgi:predicted small secreted protein